MANSQSLQPNFLKRIIRDGNCFYRLLSYIVFGCENNHSKIRQEISNHIFNISQVLEPHLSSN